MKKYDKFIKKAIKLGANDAKIIKTDSIVTSAWVRWKCRFGCDGYNSGLCCPPNTPDHKETRELVDSYQNALLIHCKTDYEHRKDLTDTSSRPWKGMSSWRAITRHSPWAAGPVIYAANAP